MLTYNPFGLEGKNILVIGATGGIGSATALECSRLGASVLLTGRNEGKLAEILARLEGKGHRTVLCDLHQAEDIEHLAAECPPLDGMVFAAGISSLTPVQAIRQQELQTIFDTNLFAPLFLTKQMLRAKKMKQGASVVYVSSISGNGNTAIGLSLYGSSKAALSGFTKYAALELSNKHIRVNAVLPGRIETPLIHSQTLQSVEQEQDLQKYPLRRYGQPREVALACCYLLSDATAWMTGSEIKIDGGRTLI